MRWPSYCTYLRPAAANGTLVNDTMTATARDKPTLERLLPKDYVPQSRKERLACSMSFSHTAGRTR